MNYTPEQKQAWDHVVSIMQENLIPYVYQTWIAPLQLHSVTAESIILAAETFVQRDTIKQRYHTNLRELVRHSFGRAYEIEIYTREELDQLQTTLEQTTLNRRYSFDNFVVGPSNSFAYAASLAVAEQPSEAYNPLFIYGSVGLGKTHLMNAIGNFITAADPSKNVLLTTSESFTNELIDSIVRKKDTSELRKRMRNVDVLMVDDIQFLARTKATQEEFFHTFNDLYNSGKQIIISSDRPPRDIPTIEERLRSRFEWGLIVDIGKPEYETRAAILNKKAAEEEIDVPYEVIDHIAYCVESNIRELEGILNRLKAQSQLQGTPITLELAQELLSQLFQNHEEKSVTPERILSIVSEQYGVSADDLLSKKRNRNVALPRQIAMYLCRSLTQLSTTNIGQAIGGRDHTTVMHGCEKIEEEMNRDFAFKKRIEELMEIVRSD